MFFLEPNWFEKLPGFVAYPTKSTCLKSGKTDLSNGNGAGGIGNVLLESQYDNRELFCCEAGIVIRERGLKNKKKISSYYLESKSILILGGAGT